LFCLALVARRCGGHQGQQQSSPAGNRAAPNQTATPIADQQQGGAMLYVLPADPASPLVSLPNLRSRAKRRGYRISYDRNTGAFTLVDSHLRRPIVGLEHVGLPEIANAIEATRRGQ